MSVNALYIECLGMQIYGNFEGFPTSSALFWVGVVS